MPDAPVGDGAPGESLPDLIVLGAGIAGLSAADRLSKAGYRVTVIERSHRCGGTHRSHQIGPYSFDVGSIFYEAGTPLFDLAEGLREMCPSILRRQRRIAPDGKVLHYPLEPREILFARPWRIPLSVADMLASRLFVRRDGSLEAISRKRLGGRFFADTGLRDYITRFHHVPPVEIAELFFFHRMAFIEKFTRLKPMIAASLRSVFTRKTVNSHVRRPLHYRPYAGYDALFAPVRQRLERAGVRFVMDTEVTAIAREEDAGGAMFRVDTSAGAFRAGAVVSSIPLEALHRMVLGTSTGLTSLDMTTLFVSASRLDERTGHVLFNFHRDGAWKRATIYSRLYPEAPTDREFLAVEVTIPPGGTHDPAAAFADFQKHMTALGLADDLRLEGDTLVESCYPLYTPDAERLLETALARVTAEGIIAVGRQGRFEYLPTATNVIHRVAEELDGVALPAPSDGALSAAAKQPPAVDRLAAGGMR